jgi:hypothetical protein
MPVWLFLAQNPSLLNMTALIGQMMITTTVGRGWRLGGSTYYWHGFNDALRSHGWNNSCELVIGSIEQSTILSFGAFPSSGHRQHIQIEKLTERPRIRVWHNHVDK